MELAGQPHARLESLEPFEPCFSLAKGDGKNTVFPMKLRI
jgi:hypothetical protein